MCVEVVDIYQGVESGSQGHARPELQWIMPLSFLSAMKEIPVTSNA